MESDDMKIDNIKCLLKPGDLVKVRDLWGPKLSGKTAEVLEVRRHINCESGFLITIDIYPRELDANWLIKL